MADLADVASDVIGLMRQAGVQADYATDPMATGVHGERSADLVLPLLLLASDAQTVLGAIDGLVAVVDFFLARLPGKTIRVRAARITTDHSDVTVVEVDVSDRMADAEAVVREALQPLTAKRRSD